MVISFCNGIKSYNIGTVFKFKNGESVSAHYMNDLAYSKFRAEQYRLSSSLLGSAIYIGTVRDYCGVISRPPLTMCKKIEVMRYACELKQIKEKQMRLRHERKL